VLGEQRSEWITTNRWSTVKRVCRRILDVNARFALALVSALLLGALLELSWTSWRAFLDKSFSKDLLVFYLSAIGLLLSVASVSFSYANCLDAEQKSKMVGAGKWFFFGAILLILSLLLNYHQVFISDATWFLSKTLRSFAFGGSIAFAFVAALTVHKAFKELIDRVFH
jgi:hypothetical protein